MSHMHTRHRRCGFHLLLALPLSKGFFWTGIALIDYSQQILSHINVTSISITSTTKKKKQQSQVIAPPIYIGDPFVEYTRIYT